jgi:hypothetical protein
VRFLRNPKGKTYNAFTGCEISTDETPSMWRNSSKEKPGGIVQLMTPISVRTSEM